MGIRHRRQFEAIGVEGLFGRKLLIAAGSVVVLASVIGLGMFAQYLWRAAEARKNAREGAALVEQKQFEKAIPLLRLAWLDAPKDPDVLRNLAKSFDAIDTNTGVSMSFWQQVVDSSQVTVDDRTALAADMVKVSDFAGVRRVLGAIPDPERHHVKCKEIEASLLRAEGDDELADKLLRAVWAASPDDPACRMKLAQLDLKATFGPIQEKAWETLWEIARDNETLAAPALISLVNSMDLDPGAVSKVRAIMASHPSISSQERLAIFGICINKVPGMTAEIEADEAKRFAGKAPEECPEFYEWLAKLGDSGRVLKDLGMPSAIPSPTPAEAGILPRPEVMRSRALFLAFADALIFQSKWRALSTLLEQPKVPAVPMETELMQALCASGLGKTADIVDDHLVAAVASARTTHNATGMRHIASISEKLGRTGVALEVYSALASDPALRLEMLKQIYNVQEKLRDADAMLRTAEAIHAMNKSLVAYGDDVIYLRLITGTDLESAWRDLASPPSKEGLTVTPLRHLTQALALQLCGNNDEAVRQLSDLDPKALPLGARAVMAGLLARSGNPTDAFSLAEKIAPAWILPEENWYRKIAVQ